MIASVIGVGFVWTMASLDRVGLVGIGGNLASSVAEKLIKALGDHAKDALGGNNHHLHRAMAAASRLAVQAVQIEYNSRGRSYAQPEHHERILELLKHWDREFAQEASPATWADVARYLREFLGLDQANPREQGAHAVGAQTWDQFIAEGKFDAARTVIKDIVRKKELEDLPSQFQDLFLRHAVDLHPVYLREVLVKDDAAKLAWEDLNRQAVMERLNQLVQGQDHLRDELRNIAANPRFATEWLGSYADTLQSQLTDLERSLIATIFEQTETILRELAIQAEGIKEHVTAEVQRIWMSGGQRAEELARQLGVAEAAIDFILVLLDKEGVTPENRIKRLVEFAQRYRDLQTQLEDLTGASPKEDDLRQRAEAALEVGHLTEAEKLLLQLQEVVDASSARLREELQRRDRKRAELRALRASAALARFAYLEAADLYGEAAGIVAHFDFNLAQQYKDQSTDALYRQGDEKGDNAALEEVISARRSKLAATPRGTAPHDWARTQSDLGNALRTLGERESGAEHLEEAVTAYRAALQEYNRDHVPLDWAGTQNNLGTVLWRLGERETGTARLEQAVAAYRAALEERTRDRVPFLWAATQNNLGLALWRLGERETGTARLEQAVAAHRAALEEWTRDRMPIKWAATQNNLGNALSHLGDRESGTARLEEAVAAYRAALEEWTRDRVPLDWATAQNNLGNALGRLGALESGTAQLEEAVAAYRAALEERTRDRVPLDWAMTQNNLGSALLRLGERESGKARLEEAEAAYRAALEEYSRHRVPLLWATTQNNLGLVLSTLGELESGTTRLEEAVAAYRAALEEWTRERLPLQWAAAQHNLGTTLWRLGKRESGTGRLEEAVAAYSAALEERARDRVPLDWAMTQNNLGNALRTLGEHESGTARLEAAAAACRAALEEFYGGSAPHYQKMAQRNLYDVLVLIQQRSVDEAKA
jgi:tetratricopeptide (TPR) repeat protein